MDERERFEATVRSWDAAEPFDDVDGFLARRDDGEYAGATARRWWALWQAARASTDDANALEIALIERDHARRQFDYMTRVLAKIYERIYPKLVTTEDGRTFRFTAPDPHLFLQALGDEIRAIPDSLPPPTDDAKCPHCHHALSSHAEGIGCAENCRCSPLPLGDINTEDAKDAARLDEIESQMWFVEPQYHTDTWRVGKANRHGQAKHHAKTLRAAIDAAMQAAPARGERGEG